MLHETILITTMTAGRLSNGFTSPELALDMTQTYHPTLVRSLQLPPNLASRFQTVQVPYSESSEAKTKEPHAGEVLLFVDHKGLEPLTSSMPWKRSSQLS